MGDWTIRFYLVPVGKENHPGLLASTGTLESCDSLRLPLNLHYYIFDTLVWIPGRPGSVTPASHGVPVIGAEGANIAENVFSAWRSLFEIGPEEIVLSCDPSTFEAGGKIVQKLNKLKIAKSELLAIFDRLRDFAIAVQSGKYLLYVIDWAG